MALSTPASTGILVALPTRASTWILAGMQCRPTALKQIFSLFAGLIRVQREIQPGHCLWGPLVAKEEDTHVNCPEWARLGQAVQGGHPEQPSSVPRLGGGRGSTPRWSRCRMLLNCLPRVEPSVRPLLHGLLGGLDPGCHLSRPERETGLPQGPRPYAQ